MTDNADNQINGNKVARWLPGVLITLCTAAILAGAGGIWRSSNDYARLDERLNGMQMLLNEREAKHAHGLEQIRQQLEGIRDAVNDQTQARFTSQQADRMRAELQRAIATNTEQVLKLWDAVADFKQWRARTDERLTRPQR